MPNLVKYSKIKIFDLSGADLGQGIRHRYV